MSNGFDKVVSTTAHAVAGIADGVWLAVGGFGCCGVPESLLDEVHKGTAGRLKVVSNNCGIDDWGLGVLLADHRIERVIASYVGENKEFARQYLAGELELELVPQGTLAERMRAGGCGIPAFYTPAGVGTAVAEGGLPWRYGSDGSVALASPRKEIRRFGDEQYVLEEAIVCDFALVHAWKGDRQGNLVYRGSARNFNPLCAMAGRVTIAEVEHLVDVGEIVPEEVHTPGIFVTRVVEVPSVGAEPGPKRIEKHTTRPARKEG